jgi:ketohexokinase
VLQQLLRHCRGGALGRGQTGTTTGGGVVVVPHLVSCLPARGSAATAKILASFAEADDDGDGDKLPLSSSADLSHCLYREGHAEPASCYILQSQAAGTRTIVNYNDLPEMTAEEFEGVADRFRDERRTWWHFEVSYVRGWEPCGL